MPVFVRGTGNTTMFQGGANWWEAGGATNCLAAYRSKGAADYAGSIVNLANPGTYNLTTTAAPAWAAGTGWSFNGTTHYLDTGIAPANANYSIFVQWANAVNNTSPALWGMRDAGQAKYMMIQLYVSTVRMRFWSYGYADENDDTKLPAGNACLAGTKGFYNGADLGVSISTGAWVTPRTIYIGGYNAGSLTSPFQGDIIAFAVYNTVLSDEVIAAVAAEMIGFT